MKLVIKIGLGSVILGVALICMACGSENQSRSSQTQSADTGSVAFHIVFEPDSQRNEDRLVKSFSSCRDINTVVGYILNQDGETLIEQSWNCEDGNGTITGISPGDRRLFVQGNYVDDIGHTTVFYETDMIPVFIRAGETTQVGAIQADLREGAPAERADQDGDGFAPDYSSDGHDCNDQDSNVYPGADEICNSVDDNCNGLIDEGVQNTYYEDSDGDGFGNMSTVTQACSPPNGHVDNGDDCDDSDADINPKAAEICGDDIDQDCDGQAPSCHVGPILQTPIMDAITPREQISFSWSDLPSMQSPEIPTQYELIVSRSSDISDFAARVFITAQSVDTVYNDAAQWLNSDQTYYWCVIAYNGDHPQGKISDVQPFHTLVVPAAVAPNMNGRFYNDPFMFNWSYSTNANGYRIIISESSELGDAVVNVTKDSNSCSLNNSGGLSFGKSYYWRVYALDSNGQYYDSYASDIRSFDILGIPEMIFPEYQTYVPNSDFSLEWSPVQNAAGYHLQVSLFSNFSELYFDEVLTGNSTTSFPLDRFSLSDAETYYWRVSAIDDTDTEGAFPGRIYFFTGDGIRITDINPNQEHSIGYELVSFGSYFFFSATDGYEWGLWKTDGTPGNYQRVSTFIRPDQLTVFANDLYFLSGDPDSYRNVLYRIEDSATDAHIPIYPSANDPSAEEYYDSKVGDLFSVPGHRLFFTCNLNEESQDIWYVAINSSIAQKTGFADTISNPFTYPLGSLTATSGGRFFFQTKNQDTPTTNADLWMSPYPYTSAQRITDDASGPWDVEIVLGDLNQELLFFAYDEPKNSDGEQHLWKSNGTAVGTTIIAKNISGAGQTAKKDNIIYFWAKDPTAGHDYLHLWRTDGTSVGTVPIESMTDERISSGVNQWPYIAVLNEHIYFRHSDTVTGDELYRCEGTYDTLENVANFLSGLDTGLSYGSDFVIEQGGRIYYRGNLDHAGNAVTRLFSTNGTQTGTKSLSLCDDTCSSSHNDNVGIPAINGDVIVFSANAFGNYGRELWRHKP